MESFFGNPGLKSRVAQHIELPDHAPAELLEIAERMLARLHDRFTPDARGAFEEYLARRQAQPRFANARAVRDALDHARQRQASRLFTRGGAVDHDQLVTLEPEDIRGGRVFAAAGATT